MNETSASLRITSVALGLAALYGLFQCWMSLQFDYGASLGALYVDGAYQVPYFHRLLGPATAITGIACVLLAFASLRVWRGAQGWRALVIVAFVIDLGVLLGLVLLAGSTTFGRSSQAALGPAGSVLVLQMGLIVLVWLVGLPWHNAIRGRSLFLLVFAAFMLPMQDSKACAYDEDCPDGQVCRGGSTYVVEECFLIIFCDSYTVQELVCVAEEPPPEEEEEERTGTGRTRVFFCPSFGDAPRDYTCQFILALYLWLERQFT
jgi:hypothetical protein